MNEKAADNTVADQDPETLTLTLGGFMDEGLCWVLNGGNVAGAAITVDGVQMEVVIRRKGFVEPDTLKRMAKDRVYTLEGFHCALGTNEINQIDGVPAAYMEVVTEAQLPAKPNFEGLSTDTERQVNRWYYSTLRFGSHLPNPQASVELLTTLFKVIKNAAETLRGTAQPLVVWRVRPEFSVNTDEGVTYLRCRLVMPGVSLPSFETNPIGGNSVFWCEGV